MCMSCAELLERHTFTLLESFPDLLDRGQSVSCRQSCRCTKCQSVYALTLPPVAKELNLTGNQALHYLLMPRGALLIPTAMQLASILLLCSALFSFVQLMIMNSKCRAGVWRKPLCGCLTWRRSS